MLKSPILVALPTVTVVPAELLPPAPVQLMVYVVVEVGDTEVEPEVPDIEKPAGAVAEQLVAPELLQVIVLLCPDVIVGGAAETLTDGAGVVPDSCCQSDWK